MWWWCWCCASCVCVFGGSDGSDRSGVECGGDSYDNSGGVAVVAVVEVVVVVGWEYRESCVLHLGVHVHLISFEPGVVGGGGGEKGDEDGCGGCGVSVDDGSDGGTAVAVVRLF